MENKATVMLIAHTPNPEQVIATAAKLCYSNSSIAEIVNGLTNETTTKFIRHLVMLGHESPFEHATFTFAIENVSRSLLAQITRHRMASYSVQSQRYVNLDKSFTYITPQAITKNESLNKIYHNQMEFTHTAYTEFSMVLKSQYIAEGMSEKAAEKKAIEDARYLLPNACETKMVVTMNARSLMNFFRLRCCNRAQEEIRTLADEMLKQVKQVCPNVFANAGPACVTGNCSEGKMSCGKPRRKEFTSHV